MALIPKIFLARGVDLGESGRTELNPEQIEVLSEEKIRTSRWPPLEELCSYLYRIEETNTVTAIVDINGIASASSITFSKEFVDVLRALPDVMVTVKAVRSDRSLSVMHSFPIQKLVAEAEFSQPDQAYCYRTMDLPSTRGFPAVLDVYFKWKS